MKKILITAACVALTVSACGAARPDPTSSVDLVRADITKVERIDGGAWGGGSNDSIIVFCHGYNQVYLYNGDGGAGGIAVQQSKFC